MIRITTDIKNAKGIIVPFRDRKKYLVINVNLNRNVERILVAKLLELVSDSLTEKEILSKAKKIVEEMLRVSLII